jgi:hypothetical protein
MTRDELRGSVEDALAVASLSDSQTTATLLSRLNGVSPKQLLAAALAVASEQTRHRRTRTCPQRKRATLQRPRVRYSGTAGAP